MEEVNLRWERVQQIAGMLSRNEDISPSLIAGIYQVSVRTAKEYISDAEELLETPPVIEERRPRILYDTASLTGMRR